jgi:hypothetical protein
MRLAAGTWLVTLLAHGDGRTNLIGFLHLVDSPGMSFITGPGPGRIRLESAGAP